LCHLKMSQKLPRTLRNLLELDFSFNIIFWRFVHVLCVICSLSRPCCPLVEAPICSAIQLLGTLAGTSLGLLGRSKATCFLICLTDLWHGHFSQPWSLLTKILNLSTFNLTAVSLSFSFSKISCWFVFRTRIKELSKAKPENIPIK
jgi:hypothetical protein